MQDLKSIFEETNEKQMAVLGEDYVLDIMTKGKSGIGVKSAVIAIISTFIMCIFAGIGGIFWIIYLRKNSKKGLCVVTDQRVYTRGHCYYRSDFGWKLAKTEKYAEINEILGVQKINVNVMSLVYRILCCLFLIWNGWNALNVFRTREMREMRRGFRIILPNATKTTLEMLVILVILATLVTLAVLAYFGVFRKQTFFVITYTGGQFAYKASDYSEHEIQNIESVINKLVDENKEVRQSRNAAFSTEQRKAEQPKNKVEELKKYKELLDTGAISQEEFNSLKNKIL